MPKMQYFYSNTSAFHQSVAYLERPRLWKLLEKAMDYPLLVVCAGSGYGKTRAVHSFLQKYNAHTTWIQLSERDNAVTRFWENYVHMISLNWPETAKRLEEIGFPETEETFAKYLALRGGTLSAPGRFVLVYDDFHLLHNPIVLRFFEKAVNSLPFNGTTILISRTMPEINMVGMMLRERIYTISEEALCFTEDEIAEYFKQLALPVTSQGIRDIYDDTQGWAFSVNMIGRSLRKDTKYERYSLEAIKANIFKMIESEISNIISESLWRFLLRISLIDHLSAGFIKTLPNADTLIREMELLNAYIRYDFQMNTYQIHHLFLGFLRQKHDQLTAEEKRETYQAAGEWCDANGYHMDALSYYEKSGDYGAIARKVGSYNIQMPPDMARYATELFDNAPDEVKFQNPIFPGMHIRLKLNVGQLNEDAIALARRYADDYEARPESPDRYRSLSIIYFNWAFLLMFKCTYTGIYDFEDYFKKFGECYGKNPFKTIGTFNIVPMVAWASLVGTNRAGAQEEFIGAMSRSIPSASVLGKGFLIGFDDLARGELSFYRGDFNEAEQYLKQAIDKSRASDQYITYNRTLVYLMQIAFLRGDFTSATRLLKEMEALLSEKDFGIRYTMYDIAHGFYQLALEQPEQAPEWLKSDFSHFMHPAYLENYANLVKAQYHYQTRQYSALLAFIENTLERQAILFGKIELNVLKALSLYQLKRHGEAIAALTEAYYLAEPNKIIILFTQYTKDMRTLTAAALRDKKCPIPQSWLENINRKASASAKRKSHIIAEYMAANNLEAGITLTKRETEILKDLYRGLSRSEIAAIQNISTNTVKMVINTIYNKLSVTSLNDAIRVALEHKII